MEIKDPKQNEKEEKNLSFEKKLNPNRSFQDLLNVQGKLFSAI